MPQAEVVSRSRPGIPLSKDQQTIELENYGIEPVRLTDVRIEE